MNDLARKLFGDDVPEKSLALIVDLDDTVCVGFDVPIRVALDTLARIDRQKVTVYYVTARVEVTRKRTAAFIEEHRLPGWKNLHLCPNHLGSQRHKQELHAKLAREHRVIASIGDTDDDEGDAARLAAIPFVLVDRDNPIPAWYALAELIEAAGGFTVVE
jgi:predicted secreted acid phosphatase